MNDDIEEQILALSMSASAVSESARWTRYQDRSQHEIVKDLNENWNVTRALLASAAKKDLRITALQDSLRVQKAVSTTLILLVLGIFAEGIKLLLK